MSLTELRFDQYISLAAQTVFNYKFQITDETDIDVYDTPAGSPASDAADIIPLSEYTVTGIGGLSGGTIIFNVGRAVSNIISIDGDKNIERSSKFEPGQFSVNEVNAAFDTQTIFSADIETGVLRRTPRYDASNVLTEAQTRLPVLANNKAWIGTIGGGIVAADLTISVDAAALEAKLADEQSGTDGALIVGYFDSVGVLGTTTVHTAIETNTTLIQTNAANIATNTADIAGIKDLESSQDYILGGAFGLNPYQSGSSFTAVANGDYIADGWKITSSTTAVIDALQSTDAPPLALNGLLSTGSQEISVFTAQASLGPTNFVTFTQPIEGYTFVALAQRQMALSFTVKAAVAGIYCVSFRNKGKDRSYIKEYTVDAINTFEEKTMLIPASPSAGTWDYTNDVGLEVNFCLGAGTTFQTAPDVWTTGDFLGTANQVNLMGTIGNKIQFEFVKIEPEIITPYVYRNRDQTLAWAQRYYEKSYNQGIDPGTISSAGLATVQTASTSAQATYSTVSFAAPKRDTPIVKFYSPVTGTIDRVYDADAPGDSAVTSVVNQGMRTPGVAVLGSAPGVGAFFEAHFTAYSRL